MGLPALAGSSATEQRSRCEHWRDVLMAVVAKRRGPLFQHFAHASRVGRRRQLTGDRAHRRCGMPSTGRSVRRASCPGTGTESSSAHYTSASPEIETGRQREDHIGPRIGDPAPVIRLAGGAVRLRPVSGARPAKIRCKADMPVSQSHVQCVWEGARSNIDRLPVNCREGIARQAAVDLKGPARKRRIPHKKQLPARRYP